MLWKPDADNFLRICLYKHFQLRRLLRTELRSLSFVNPNSLVDLNIGFTRNAPASSNPWRIGNRYHYLLFFLYDFSPVILQVNSSFRIITSLRCLLSGRCKDEVMINLRLQTMKSFSCHKQAESRKCMNRHTLVDFSNNFLACLEVWLFFKMFFNQQYIKIIFFYFLKLFLISVYQNNLKISKKY
jgi:hypothetical protein